MSTTNEDDVDQQLNWAQQAERLSERDDEYWKPEPGDSTAGRVLAIQTNGGKQGNSMLIESERQDGSCLYIWGCASIESQIERYAVEPGDVIVVKFLGKREPKKEGGNAWNSYRLKPIERNGGATAMEDNVPF